MASTDKSSKLPPIKAAPTATPPTFTSEMRDRQARNKDPITGLPSSPSNEDEGRSSRKAPKMTSADDSYEASERRRWAAAVLDSPELVMMHAISRDESIPCTRYHFEKILCGYEDPPKAGERKGARKEKEKDAQVSDKNYVPYTGPYEL